MNAECALRIDIQHPDTQYAIHNASCIWCLVASGMYTYMQHAACMAMMNDCNGDMSSPFQMSTFLYNCMPDIVYVHVNQNRDTMHTWKSTFTAWCTSSALLELAKSTDRYLEHHASGQSLRHLHSQPLSRMLHHFRRHYDIHQCPTHHTSWHSHLEEVVLWA